MGGLSGMKEKHSSVKKSTGEVFHNGNVELLCGVKIPGTEDEYTAPMVRIRDCASTVSGDNMEKSIVHKCVSCDFAKPSLDLHVQDGYTVVPVQDIFGVQSFFRHRLQQ